MRGKSWGGSGQCTIPAQDRGSIIRYYLRDGQDSTRTLTDSSGSITDSYAYTAFGELLAQGGATANAYLYTGQQYDALTGLYYLRARYYAPSTGRFLSRDAVCCVPEDPAEHNRYTYARANPTNFGDPSGYEALAEYVQTYQVSREAQQALVLVGAATACAYLYVISVQMAINHDRTGLLLLELSMPSPSWCHIPVLLYPAPATPTIAQHIRDAQDMGWPMLLHYLGPLNPQAKINYNRACPPAVRRAMNAQGLWCDEYPFKTTTEGGAASIRGVPPWEQRMQGGILAAFYATKLLFRPGAPFAVVVVDWRP